MKNRSRMLWGVFMAFALFPTQGEAQRGRSQVEEGNRLYSEGRFDEAHRKYLEALLEDPASPLIRFNDGNALYQGEDYEKAMERFKEALAGSDPGLVDDAWYNLGNALYRQQRLQESLETYKQALRANPSDADAKYNLERVLEQLQKQENQQEQQQGDEGQQKNQDEGQNQPSQGQDQSQQDQPSGETPQPQEGEAPTEDPSQQDAQQPRPGEMTPQEAERLLNAIREDPGDVNRMRVPITGKRPRKKW